MAEVENFEGLDESVTSAIEVWIEKGFDGGSFVTALIAQDYKEAMLHAHKALTRSSIIKHMEYAAEKIAERPDIAMRVHLHKINRVLGEARDDSIYLKVTGGQRSRYNITAKWKNPE